MNKAISFLISLIFTLNIGGINVWATPSITHNSSNDTFIYNLLIDGVNVKLELPFKVEPFISSSDNEIFQSATSVYFDNFFEVSLSAIPTSADQLIRYSLGVPAGENITSYQQALSNYRKSQSGITISNFPIQLFGDKVMSISNLVNININSSGLEPVNIHEWTTEAGGRLWIFRISHIENQDYQDLDLKGIAISSNNINNASIIESLLSNQESSFEIDVPESTLSDLPFPPWWNGDCDSNNFPISYPLGGSYRGVKACGPFPNVQWRWVNFGVGALQIEWECPELSKRYLYLAYGIAPYIAHGKDVVWNCPSTLLEKISNGTVGKAPQEGDVLSYGPTETYGHTSIVSSSSVDSIGNGSITVVEQNYSPSGVRTHTVSNWSVYSDKIISGWLHYQSIDDKCSTTVPLPSGFNKCADEGGTCNYSGTADVAFGSNDKYTIKNDVVNSISCTNEAFGCDPNPGVFKGCYYKIKDDPHFNWSAKYYDDHTHWWDNTNESNLKCTESFNSSVLDKNYGTGAPCGDMDPNDWVADYKGTVNFSSGNYVFWVNHDDGLKLWLNNTNIWDNGSSDAKYLCPPRSLSGDENLWAILREDGGDARVRISWTTDKSVCDPPTDFLKISPINGESGISTNPTINWNSSSKVDSYEYCIDTSNNNACNTSWVNMGNITSKTLNGLNSGTIYYWQIRAVNPYGYKEANNGSWWSFTTIAPPPGDFHKIAPSNGAIGQSTSPTLSWEPSSGATHYGYCIDTSNDNVCSPWYSIGLSTSKTLSGLSPNTTYYWHVWASSSNPTLTYSDGSSTAFWHFTTIESQTNKLFLPLGFKNYYSGTEETISNQISANDHDGYEDPTFNISGDDYNHNWIGTGTQIKTGLIFGNVQIPKGATILKANISMRGFGNDGDATARIHGFAQNNPPAFSSDGDNKPSTRPLTSGYVDWPNTWTFAWQTFTTPDISKIVQEIVDRSGWSDGNNMGFVLSNPSGTGTNWSIVDYAGGIGHEVDLEVTYTTRTNMLTNGGFELGTYSPGGEPDGWQRDAFNYSNAEFTWDNTQSHVGEKSVKISASIPNDARWIQIVPVHTNTDYRLSGWIKTIEVDGEGPGTAGANIGLYGTWDHTTGLVGTNDWTYVYMDFNSGSNTEISVDCRLGNWSDTVSGTMWCDNIRLEPFN